MERVCLNCNSETTYINSRGIECWFKHKDGYLCKKCRCKLIDNPKWHPITNPIWNPRYNRRKLRWQGKQIILKERVLQGMCSNCGKEGLTHMHHIEYHLDDPLRDTVELCVGCHDKTH